MEASEPVMDSEKENAPRQDDLSTEVEPTCPEEHGDDLPNFDVNNLSDHQEASVESDRLDIDGDDDDATDSDRADEANDDRSDGLDASSDDAKEENQEVDSRMLRDNLRTKRPIAKAARKTKPHKDAEMSQCPICFKKFARRYCVIRHLQKVHALLKNSREAKSVPASNVGTKSCPFCKKEVVNVLRHLQACKRKKKTDILREAELSSTSKSKSQTADFPLCDRPSQLLVDHFRSWQTGPSGDGYADATKKYTC